MTLPGYHGKASVTKQIVIMEDLFQGRDISYRFDLKGIVRKAVKNGDEMPSVLLDDNLMEFTDGFPLPIQVIYMCMTS